MGGNVMQTGKLIVRVYATSAQLPLEGATVVVTKQNKNGKFDLVSLQKTDRSGLTKPIEIQTPDRLDSVSNDTAVRAPFTVCDVWAEHPGFTVLRVEGVQIFPGIVTRQDMEMIPLGEGEHGLGGVDRRDVTVQNL